MRTQPPHTSDERLTTERCRANATAERRRWSVLDEERDICQEDVFSELLSCLSHSVRDGAQDRERNMQSGCRRHGSGNGVERANCNRFCLSELESDFEAPGEMGESEQRKKE